MSSFVLKAVSVTLALGSMLALTGCSQFADGVREGYEKARASTSSTPTPSMPSSSEAPQEESAAPKTQGTPVSQGDLDLASASFAPKKAVSGSYIVVNGYKYFDTLTVFKLESGETVYFASSGGAPFGSLQSGMSIAADQSSRDITGFGESVPATGPAGMDAAKMLQDHKGNLGI